MIALLDVYKQSLLMAKLSSLAYNKDQSFKDLGYESKYIFKKGSEAYLLWDRNDLIIVCRGTQPNKFEDIVADIRFNLISNGSTGRVHAGFKHSVDLLWPQISVFLEQYGLDRKIWCTGHSLGAAMATIIAERIQPTVKLKSRTGVGLDEPSPYYTIPVLFTFGSPRVGDIHYHDRLIELGITHYRWVNNADVVTRNPIIPYHHHGILYYMDHNGNLKTMSRFRTAVDRIKGFITGIKKGNVNFFVNHFIDNYVDNIEKIVQNDTSSNTKL